MTTLRILVVADDPLVRAGLYGALAADESVEVSGQEHGAADLATAVDLYRAEAVLWDMGWDATPDLMRKHSNRLAAQSQALPPVLALVADVDGSIAIAADLRIAGAGGVLLRDARPAALAAALHALVEGLVVFDPVLALASAGRESAPPLAGFPHSPLPEALTPREIEVLQLLAEGLPNKGIARRLGISEHTVKFHINAILGKLGVQSRTEAVVRATRLGMLLL